MLIVVERRRFLRTHSLWHERCVELLKMSRIDARETTSHTHEPRKGKSRMWCECAVLCDRRARRFLRAVAATRADACLS